MKPLKLALFLGTSLGLANLVLAEPFNDRSEWMTTAANPSGSQLSTTAASVPENFKEQSEWATTIPSRGPSQCAITSSRGANPFPNRFNDSSSNVC